MGAHYTTRNRKTYGNVYVLASFECRVIKASNVAMNILDLKYALLFVPFFSVGCIIHFYHSIASMLLVDSGIDAATDVCGELFQQNIM